MAKKKNAADGGEGLDFEHSLEELETIVRRLEQGGGALEEALGDYSMAIQLLKNCHQRLELAERKVELLSGIDAQGNPVTEPLSDESTTLVEKQAGRAARRSVAEKPRKTAEDVTGLF